MQKRKRPEITNFTWTFSRVSGLLGTEYFQTTWTFTAGLPPPIHIVPTVLPTVPCALTCSSHLVFRVSHSWISNQNPSLFVMIHLSFLSVGVALHTSLHLKPTTWHFSLMSLKDHLKFRSRAGSVCYCPEALRVLSWLDWCLWGMQGALCDPTAMGWQWSLSRWLVAQKSFSSPGCLQSLSHMARKSSGSFLWWRLNNQDGFISKSLAWLYLQRLSPREITLCDDSNTGLIAWAVKFSSSSLFWKSLKKLVFSIKYLVEFISEANWVWVSLFKVVFDYWFNFFVLSIPIFYLLLSQFQ